MPSLTTKSRKADTLPGEPRLETTHVPVFSHTCITNGMRSHRPGGGWYWLAHLHFTTMLNEESFDDGAEHLLAHVHARCRVAVRLPHMLDHRVGMIKLISTSPRYENMRRLHVACGPYLPSHEFCIVAKHRIV